MPLLIYAVVLLCVSLATGVALAWDKRAARKRRWRVSERTLHTLELLGGWPGSLLVRPLIRHKTRKRSYRVVFTLIVLLHAALTYGLWKLGG